MFLFVESVFCVHDAIAVVFHQIRLALPPSGDGEDDSGNAEKDDGKWMRCGREGSRSFCGGTFRCSRVTAQCWPVDTQPMDDLDALSDDGTLPIPF